jgi:nucleoside-diphosphate-sugar epimerase
MRVFVVGASGAIGSRLVPQLVERGHDLIGTSRSAEKAERLRGLGAKSVVLDVFDAGALREAVAAAQPDAIVYQATALDGLSDFNNFDRSFAETNRLRTEGTDNVLAAARAARVPRVVAQSAAAHRYAREGGAVKNEDDLLDPTPPPEMRETLEALAYLDEAVTGAGGVALRYGVFYGNPVDPVGNAVSAGQWPIVGNGGPAIYNVVDDEPVTAAVWLAELAKILDATPPQRVSSEQARDFAGETSVVISTESRGASNTKAKRELGWTLRYPTWRQGFAAVYAGREPLRGAA